MTLTTHPSPNTPNTGVASSGTRLQPLTYMGDRPAQLCGIVAAADLRYTGDRLTPFQVLALVERYIEENKNKTGYMTTQRRILLSTGLMWAQKYDGVVAKQLNTLISGAFIAPLVYVLPVSSRLVTAHAINTKLLEICTRTELRRETTRFLGTWVDFSGDAMSPSQPTPLEALNIIDLIEK